MTIILPLILTAFGFVLLIKGADWLVEGASALATRFSVSPMMIGLTIVAFGTSTPELIVNVIAAYQKNAAICYGNVIGSNTANILLILGVAALIRPLATARNTVWREIPFALLAVLVLWILSFDTLWNGSVGNILSRGDAVILFLFFVIFLTYVFGMAKVSLNAEPEVVTLSIKKIVLYTVFGLFGLVVGGRFVVLNAVKIAGLLGTSQKVIGLTIVAIGTSLPELVTSTVAAYKNKIDIAVGNVVGSNIFNIFFILAISGLISPLPFDIRFHIDLVVLLLATLLLFFSMFTGVRRRIDRWEAVVFLLIYSSYMIYLYI
ncbi:calcium/sodium antiporter [candidate division KSB1 bacterium]|nr:calcium/sodium antiporter [candidate division KSB1 bacterium]RQW00290.1 MAG: calcium/sodium antiporter [candidate division KSB1 bacterium]